MYNTNELLNAEIEELVEFYHDLSAEANRKHRKNNAKKWRSDRKSYKKWPMVDVPFTKKQLHRANRRRSLDVTSSDYYKDINCLGGVCYART